jgi:hypothetical protein
VRGLEELRVDGQTGRSGVADDFDTGFGVFAAESAQERQREQEIAQRAASQEEN